MTWNYRIIEFAEHRALHEVYFDDSGRPRAYSALSFGCGLHDEIADALKMALRDVERFPILLATVFDLPIEQRPECRMTRTP